MRSETWQASYAIFPALILLHLFVSPYTKVEESFNIQATYDILSYGIPIKNAHLVFKTLFDHMTFPGAVPRTFLGAIILAGASKPLIWLADLTGENAQTCVRGMLGMLNALALIVYSRQIRSTYGNATASWYTFFQASQFHIIYYSSRTLPNMFAFCLSTLALAAFIPVPVSRLGPTRRSRLGIYLLTIATVIFRSELALLLGSQGLWMLYKAQSLSGRVSLVRTIFIPAVLSATVAGLLLTIGIDTYFWQSRTWLWPELSAFLSNIFPSSDGLGASAWGTSPWNWYLTNAIPRLLMSQVIVLIMGMGLRQHPNDGRLLDATIPSLLYTFFYSFLPHKETRFLFPIAPSITLATAHVAAWSTSRMSKSLVSQLWGFFIIFSTIATAFVSHGILLPLSAQNYPGGNSIGVLHQYHYSRPMSQRPEAGNTNNPKIHVHLTNLALQSGVTRFLEQPASIYLDSIYSSQGESQPLVIPGSPDGKHAAVTLHPKPTPLPLEERKALQATWKYDKSSNESLFLEPDFWSQFDYVIVEDPARAIGAWEVVREIRGLGRPKILRPEDDQRRLFFRSEASESSTSQNGPGEPPSMQAMLQALYGNWFGKRMYEGYAILHDLLRSAVRGYWIDWTSETRLYILKATHSGVQPNHPSSPATATSSATPQNAEQADEEILGLPQASDDDHESSGARKEIYFDVWGPMVVNKDGTLSRIENWNQMTDNEQARTIVYLKKRNKLRLANVEAWERSQTE